MDVIIPHLPSAQQGCELRLAIEGWKRHFKSPMRLILVGEGLPQIDGVVSVESPRVPDVPGQYRQHLDYVSCVRRVRELFPDSEGFITSADDVFAVNDFTIEDVMLPKVQDTWIPTVGAKNHPNAWRRNLAKTGIVCHRDGLGTWNWTTHLPHYYEWERLFSIYDKYDCGRESYVVENLYYNYYKPEREPFLLNRNDRWKYEVSFTPLYRPDLYNAFSSKVWVTTTENGWSRDLELELAKHYGIEI